MNRYLALQKTIELGSFTGAAEALGYTQSAVSQMIASLEEELSLTLLHRSRTGVALTAEGKALYPAVERLILAYKQLGEKAAEIRGLDTGVVRIGTVSSVSCHWLPSLIKEFQLFYPKVQFVLHQGDYSSITEWIRTDRVDFGFITPLAAKRLRTKLVKRGEMSVILPEGHPLAALERVPLARLVEEPFILLEEGHYSEPLEAFRACGLKPDIRYTIHDDYAIMTMVESGLGVSILADLVLRRTAYRIVARPCLPPISRTLAVGFRDENSLPAASKTFLAFLAERLDRLP